VDHLSYLLWDTISSTGVVLELHRLVAEKIRQQPELIEQTEDGVLRDLLSNRRQVIQAKKPLSENDPVEKRLPIVYHLTAQRLIRRK